MRVATHNIRHGAPERWPFARNAAMARTVAGLGADVVALQEVDRWVVRSWFADQARRAARRSGTEAHFAPLRALGPGGRYGNALLVRGRTLRRVDLALASRGEARGALLARVALATGELTVAATHLQNRRRGRPHEAPEQLQALLDELDRWPGPWCVMGDLNLRADVVPTLAAAAGYTAVDAGPTYPASAPRLALDWVLVRGVSPGRVEVPDVRTSDHRPVVVTLGSTQQGARSLMDGVARADPSAVPSP